MSIMRGGKMKNTKVKLVVLSLSVLLPFLIVAGTLYAYDSVVTGKNNAEIDVKAVQEAVDKGGTVLLKGTFKFGQKGRVNIKNDIEVMGESDSEGRPLTKIMGGFWTFHSPLPSTELPLPGPGPKMKIKNIHFDGAIWTPMHFPYTSGAEISGNKITNDRVGGGQRPPSAHRTVRTGPYTAPHVTFIHRFRPNQWGCFSSDLIFSPTSLM